MNERERIEFDIVVRHLYKNLGDELVKKFRPGMDYYRDLENRFGALVEEKNRLERENRMLQASSASTAEIPAIKDSDCRGTETCRKRKMCANWEPEPQTPAEGSGVKGAALERDEDKHATEKLPVVEPKVSFFKKLFGG